MSQRDFNSKPLGERSLLRWMVTILKKKKARLLPGLLEIKKKIYFPPLNINMAFST